MTAQIEKRRKFLLSWCTLSIANLLLVGCRYFPESTFELAHDSRLPKWFHVPPEHTRANIKITMSYYIKPWGRSALFSLQSGNERAIEKISAEVLCEKPFHSASLSGSAFNYPAYQVVSADGVTEIIEHKKMEAVFYVTDDPAVWRQYKANGCN